MASDSGCGWQLVHEVNPFLERAGDFLRSRPALHTVLLTVTEALRTHGPRVYGDEAPLFGVLDGEGGQGGVRAAFFRTPPHGLTVTGLSDEEADALAVTLAGIGQQLPTVFGD